MYEIAYSAVLSKQKIDQNDISSMLVTQMQKDLNTEQIKELLTMVKKYPEQFGNFEEQINKMIENLNQVKLLL